MRKKNVFSLSWDLAWCVMLLFLGFYQFLMKVMLEWLIDSILGALLYNMKKQMFWLQFQSFFLFACVILSLFIFCQFWMGGKLEWLVRSISGALLEDLFVIGWKKRFDPIFGLCMMCNVIVSQILLFLEGRWAGLARVQHHRGYLGGFIYNMMGERFWLAVLKDLFTMWRKKCFNPIFGLFKLCNVIISQILSILDKRWAGMARPQHLKGLS